MTPADKTQISANFIFTKLLSLGGSGYCLVKYLEARKVDDLYTELWFLGIIFFLAGFAYFFTRPKVYFDDSNFYCKEINKKEKQISFKNIQTIEINPFPSGRGLRSYEVVFKNEANQKEKIKFQVELDSCSVMEDVIAQIKNYNHFVKII